MKKQAVQRYLLLAASLFASSLIQAQTTVSNIPQIVDGGPWQTTIAVTNTGSTPAAASLSFWQETGNQQTGIGTTVPWNLIFAERNTVQTQALNLPAGTTLFLHTLGTAITATVGWGELTETAGDTGAVVAYAIFTQRVPGRSDQEGTASAVAGVNRILVPFDNTNGNVTTLAVANPTLANENISVGIHTSVSTTQPTGFSLTPQGHTSFDFPTMFPGTAGQTGLAEFYTTGSISIIALRFNTGAFTTAPVYNVTGAPLIASIVP